MTNQNISIINDLDDNFSKSKLAHQFTNGSSKEQFELIPHLLKYVPLANPFSVLQFL